MNSTSDGPIIPGHPDYAVTVGRDLIAVAAQLLDGSVPHVFADGVITSLARHDPPILLVTADQIRDEGNER